MEGQGAPCAPHYFPDFRRRVLKEGDTMYFIRKPGRYLEDTSSPVKGLDEPDSLQSLQDKDLFERKLEGLGCLKAEVKKKQDEDEDAIMARVKKRRVEPEDEDAIMPLGEQTMQTGSETMQTSDNDFLSFFDLPCNCRVEKNALVIVIKNLRGDLGWRISNKMGQMETQMDAQMQDGIAGKVFEGRQKILTEVISEVAKYLVHAYNHPDSDVQVLQDMIKKHGAECIRSINQWLDINWQMFALDQQTVDDIFIKFQNCVNDLAGNIEPETRMFVAKSRHKIPCTKVRIHSGSPLLGCYSGDVNSVVAKFKKDGDRSKDFLDKVPNLCQNLRGSKKITVLATLTSDDTFKLMPGPYDAFQEGHIFLSCEICQGTVIEECNCAEWLDKVKVEASERRQYQFDLDEVVVPRHVDNYCFGSFPWKAGQGALDLRRFTADETHDGGLQLVGLTRDTED